MKTEQGNGQPRLRAVSVSGYRSFAETARLELRPLTFLYGYNNAGKSALLRLLKIVADSAMDDARSPFDISNVADGEATFANMLSQFQDHKRMRFSLEWQQPNGKQITDQYELMDLSERGRVIISQLWIVEEGQSIFKAQALPHPEEQTFVIGGPDGAEESFQLSFSGIVPTEECEVPPLRDLRRRLVSLRRRVQWLQSVRVHPSRLVVKKGTAVRMLDPDGGDAAEALVASTVIEQDVARYYARPTINRRLEVVEKAHPHYRVCLTPGEGPAHQIDIVDTGEGMLQVLPILVAAALARQSSSILAIEEPESHLHGNAQQVLAAHLAEIAGSPDPPSILIETHSRLLMLGIQLEIAAGRLPTERVCVHWVDQEKDGQSVVSLVELNGQGQPVSGWPRSALGEDRSLARQLLEQQLASAAHES